MVESLKRWIGVLQEHLSTLKVQKKPFHDQLRAFFQSYTEPVAGASIVKKKKKHGQVEDISVCIFYPPLFEMFYFLTFYSRRTFHHWKRQL
jgi:hypothetical protein